MQAVRIQKKSLAKRTPRKVCSNSNQIPRQRKRRISASGISPPELDELDVLLEDIIEREKLAEESRDNESKKSQQEKATAEGIRTKAMERMGQTKKRKSEEDDFEIKKEKKRRRSGSEAIEFLQEKSEKEMELREKEIELKAKEQEGKADQFSQMMQGSASHATTTSTATAANPESPNSYGTTE